MKNLDTNIRWTTEGEKLLASWAEKASGLRWMHEKSSKYFKKYSTYLSIPCILITTVSGTASFIGANSKSPQEARIFSYAIGVANLSAALLTALQNYLKFAENSDKHMVVSKSFSEYYRSVSSELSIPRRDRAPFQEYMQKCRQEFDRMVKDSPAIPEHIIANYKKAFKDSKVSKPEIANGTEPVKIYYRDEESINEDAFFKLRTFYNLRIASKENVLEPPLQELTNATSNV